MKIKKICKTCKIQFLVYEYRIKEGRGKFCSKICHDIFQQGKKPWNTGKKCPSLSLSKLGNRNPMWKGGYDKKKADREYGIKNREKIYNRQKEWITKNPEKNRIPKRQWAKNNRDKRNIQWEKRRAKELANGGTITKKEWDNIIKMQNNRCKICKKEKKLTIDHVIPVSRWGEWKNENKPNYKCGDKENIQGLCRECNSRKGNKLSTSYPLAF